MQGVFTMQGLTEKQKAVFKFILKYRKENKISPTYREIADQLKLKEKSGAASHVNALVCKGWITRTPGFRTIVPVEGKNA